MDETKESIAPKEVEATDSGVHSGADYGIEAILDQFRVMLIGTSDSANAGAACRAMANFGVERLVLVSPRADDIKDGRARALACFATDILENAVMAPDMAEAANRAEIDYFAGFTARTSHVRGPFHTPEEFTAEALEVVRSGKTVALTFGREDTGLVNDEIDRCRWKINIPTTPNASLNLAQAVCVSLYEIRRQLSEEFEQKIIRQSNPAKAEAAEAPARAEDMERLTTLYNDLFHTIDFALVDNPEKSLRPFRQMILRAEITQREAGLLMSLARRSLQAIKGYDYSERSADDHPSGD